MEKGWRLVFTGQGKGKTTAGLVLVLHTPLAHMALTGRGAPPGLVAAADLATEMTMVCHSFREQGVNAQAEIEC